MITKGKKQRPPAEDGKTPVKLTDTPGFASQGRRAECFGHPVSGFDSTADVGVSVDREGRRPWPARASIGPSPVPLSGLFLPTTGLLFVAPNPRTLEDAPEGSEHVLTWFSPG